MAILSPVRSMLGAMVRPFGYQLTPIATQADPDVRRSRGIGRFSHVEPILEQAESQAKTGDFDSMLRILQQLSLGDFAYLMMAPPSQFPAMSSLLPRAASKDVQLEWTGAHDSELLLQSLLFVKGIEAAFPRFLGRQLHNATILDFGCGWGRLIRLMLWFSHPRQVHGVDPWERSLQICKDDRVPGVLAQSERVPQSLPFADVQFDLVYAFSVFTHLSERAMLAAQAAIRQRIKEHGLLVITIRPIEYWDRHPLPLDSKQYSEILSQHRLKGFVFVPHEAGLPVDGEATYGDASMSLDYIREHWPSWHICGYDHNVQDEQQIIVFLRPR